MVMISARLLTRYIEEFKRNYVSFFRYEVSKKLSLKLTATEYKLRWDAAESFRWYINSNVFEYKHVTKLKSTFYRQLWPMKIPTSSQYGIQNVSGLTMMCLNVNWLEWPNV